MGYESAVNVFCAMPSVTLERVCKEHDVPENRDKNGKFQGKWNLGSEETAKAQRPEAWPRPQKLWLFHKLTLTPEYMHFQPGVLGPRYVFQATHVVNKREIQFLLQEIARNCPGISIVVNTGT